MAYSLKKIPNDPTLFPAPQTWMTWIESHDYVNHGSITNNDGNVVYDYELIGKGEGKLSHHYSLAEARKSLLWIARTGRGRAQYRSDRYKGKVALNFAVYEFADGEWVKRFEGHQGQRREDCPLFARGLQYDKTHPIDKANEDLAIRSILEAAS